MDTNKALVLNGEFSRKEHSVLNYARNVQLTEDYKAIENEDGFEEIVRLVVSDGSEYEILGHLLIDTDVLVFANIVIAGTRYFCIIELDSLTNETKVYLKTSVISVQPYLNNVTARFTYNYKKERIIFWCDGNNEFSNPPHCLNIDNNDYVNPVTGELSVTPDRLKWFVDVENYEYHTTVYKGGNLKGGAYFYTTRSYYEDDIVTPWDVIRGPIYIGDESGKNYNNAIALDIYAVPSRVQAIEVAFILKSEGIVTSKIKGKYATNVGGAINNSENTIKISIANNEGTDVDLKELLIKNSNISKVGTIGMVNNKLYAAGIVEEDSFINYQKYANDIIVTWEDQSDAEVLEETTCFQDGEVYAFDISLLLTSGAQTPPYHIPGREPLNEFEAPYSKDPTDDKYYTNYWLTGIARKQISKPKDTLVANDFKMDDYPNGIYKVKVNISLYINSVWTVSSIIEYNSYAEFLALSNNCTVSNVGGVVATSGNGKLKLTKNTSGDPTPADNSSYKVEILIRQTEFSAYEDISIYFPVCNKLNYFHGGYTYNNNTAAKTRYQTDIPNNGIMSYWENKNEYYRSDDIIVYPEGRVRHHRFPTMREMGYVKNSKVRYKNVRLKPVFNNIHIPQHIRHLVKGIVISYHVKDVTDKTIYYSQLMPLVAFGNTPSQGIAYSVNNYSYYKGTGYFKVINNDLLYAEASNLITHISPVGVNKGTYDIYPVNDNHFTSSKSRNKSLGYEFKSNEADKLLIDTIFDYKNFAAQDSYKNAIVVTEHEYVGYNKESSKLDDNGVAFNNQASCAFSMIKLDFNDGDYAGNTTTQNKRNSNTLTRALIGGRWTYDYNYIFANGCRHITAVTGNDGGDYGVNQRSSIEGYIPSVYAYAMKDDVHFGITDNKDRAVCIVKDITSNINDNVHLLKAIEGDVRKSNTKRIEYMFPFRPVKQSVFVNASAVEYDTEFGDLNTSTKDGHEAYLAMLADFNAGKENECSYAVHNFDFAGSVDATKYYTKGEKNRILVEEGYIDKIIYANLLADMRPYYDKDHHSLNVYGAPIADTNYKQKINESFNVICWSDTANDIRSNVSNLRIFRSSNRYYMPIEDGKIINIVERPNSMYIQQEHNLSFAFVKDSIYDNGSKIYTGSGDIFDRPPRTILNDAGDRIRCTHAWHCVDTTFGVCVIDNHNNGIYLINQDEAKAISHINCETFFKDKLHDDFDNPLDGRGWRIGVNSQKNVLYITCVDPLDLWTMSFNAVMKGWHSFHDYYEMYMFDTGSKFYSINKGYIYEHSKGNKGLFYRDYANTRPRHVSFFDVVCSDKRDVNKVFETVIYESKYIDVTVNQEQYDRSVDRIMVYNESQCSESYNVTAYHGDGDWYDINKRNVGAIWRVHAFRDAVANNKLPFIDWSNGSVIMTNIDLNKDWYNSNYIISNAMVVRFEMNNVNDNIVQVVGLSIYARKSNV